MGALAMRIIALTLSVAAILLAIAALVRTIPSLHIQWGTPFAALAAIGTVGTLTWSVGQGLHLIAQGNREMLRDQARLLSAWTVPLAEHIARESFPVAQYGNLPYGQFVHLTNSSAEAAYEVVVHLVWTQGAAAHTGEEIETHYGSAALGELVTRMRAIVQVLPPETYWLPLAGPTNMPPQGRLGLEVAFTDGAGRHWVRRAPTGKLEQLTAPPVEHYGIQRPLQYGRIQPWRP